MTNKEFFKIMIEDYEKELKVAGTKNSMFPEKSKKDCIIFLNAKIAKYKQELSEIEKKEYAEKVKRFKMSCDKRYYVTIWENYPIFEEAEGGYYYNGKHICEQFAFNSRKKAIKFYQKHLTDIFNITEDCMRIRHWGNGAYNKYDNILFETVYCSEYIGENYGMCVSHGRIYGSGKQIYC